MVRGGYSVMETLHTALQGKMGSTTLGEQPQCVEDTLPHKVVLTSEVTHNLESPELPYCYIEIEMTFLRMMPIPVLKCLP